MTTPTRDERFPDLKEMPNVINLTQKDNQDLYNRLHQTLYHLHWEDRNENLVMGRHYFNYRLELNSEDSNMATLVPQVVSTTPKENEDAEPPSGIVVYIYHGNVGFIVGRAKDSNPAIDICYKDVRDVVSFMVKEMNICVGLNVPEELDYLFPVAKPTSENQEEV